MNRSRRRTPAAGYAVWTCRSPPARLPPCAHAPRCPTDVSAEYSTGGQGVVETSVALAKRVLLPGGLSARPHGDGVPTADTDGSARQLSSPRCAVARAPRPRRAFSGPASAAPARRSMASAEAMTSVAGLHEAQQPRLRRKSERPAARSRRRGCNAILDVTPLRASSGGRSPGVEVAVGGDGSAAATRRNRAIFTRRQCGSAVVELDALGRCRFRTARTAIFARQGRPSNSSPWSSHMVIVGNRHRRRYDGRPRHLQPVKRGRAAGTRQVTPAQLVKRRQLLVLERIAFATIQALISSSRSPTRSLTYQMPR